MAKQVVKSFSEATMNDLMASINGYVGRQDLGSNTVVTRKIETLQFVYDGTDYNVIVVCNEE